MNAAYFVHQFGKSAIGKTIFTEQVGDYPGGEAVVTQIRHDKNAPEIVMLVKHPTFGECGIFDSEEIRFITSNPPPSFFRK